jgi:hypothetical protein
MNLLELSQYAQVHDARLIPLIKEFLARKDVQGMKGAQRIEVVCENFKFLSFEQAYRLIDPGSFQDEFEDTQSYGFITKILNYVRITLSLAPLILTWFALFSAASGYQNDLSKYASDKQATFLQLWQDGFHHTTALTFSLTALIDVIFLFCLLACSVAILRLEYRAQKTAKRFAEDLSEITEGLLKAVNTEGVSPVTSQADIDKIVKAVRVALGGVFTTTEDTIKKALDVVLKANDRVEHLFTNQVQPLFTKFEQNVSTFHIDVNKLTQEVTTVAIASTALATASKAMAASAIDMATSANTLQASTKQIDTHIVALNKTEGEMVTKIEVSQQKIAGEINKAAYSMNVAAASVNNSSNKMDQAAQKVETVGNTLATINPQNVQKMSDSATTFINKTNDTAAMLQAMIYALQQLSGQQPSPKRTKKLFGVFPRP